MFDFAWSEIALIGVVALVFIGPKDLPVAIKAVAEMVKKARRMAGEFQTHVDEMVREANLHEVRDQFNELRRMDIKGQILKAVDSDGSIRKTLHENPVDFTPPPPLVSRCTTARRADGRPSADARETPSPSGMHDHHRAPPPATTLAAVPGVGVPLARCRRRAVPTQPPAVPPAASARAATPPAFIPPVGRGVARRARLITRSPMITAAKAWMARANRAKTPRRRTRRGGCATPDDDPIDDKPMPLLDHLIELRRRLLWSMVTFLVCFARLLLLQPRHLLLPGAAAGPHPGAARQQPAADLHRALRGLLHLPEGRVLRRRLHLVSGGRQPDLHVRRPRPLPQRNAPCCHSWSRARCCSRSGRRWPITSCSRRHRWIRSRGRRPGGREHEVVGQRRPEQEQDRRRDQEGQRSPAFRSGKARARRTDKSGSRPPGRR